MENNFKDSPYREIFENNLRSIGDRKHTNDAIMTLFDQSVEQIVIEQKAELLERYNKSQEALESCIIQIEDDLNAGCVDPYFANLRIAKGKEALNPKI